MGDPVTSSRVTADQVLALGRVPDDALRRVLAVAAERGLPVKQRTTQFRTIAPAS